MPTKKTMTNKSYERELVPVPHRTRLQQIVVSTVCIVLGGYFIVTAAIPPHDDWEVKAACGGIVAGMGIFFLIYTLRKTHELALTTTGFAAKATDDAMAASRNAKIDAFVALCTIWAAVIFGAVYLYEPVADSFSNRIPVYPLVCEKLSPETGACTRWQPGHIVKFIVHVDQQLVIALFDDAAEPVKLSNCVVADKNNWSCTTTPDVTSTHEVMRQGEFLDEASVLATGNVRYVARWRYMSLKYLNR